MDYKAVLRKIYTPEVGSIWKSPNKIWSTDFARDEDGDSVHPSIVEKLKLDGVSVQLAPGTSKDYNKGSCTFKVVLNNNEKFSYFLLKLSMPYIIEELLELTRGWDGIDTLADKQLEDFKWQIKICKG